MKLRKESWCVPQSLVSSTLHSVSRMPEEGGHDVTSRRQFVRSHYIPRARFVDASYKDHSVDEVTTGVKCFLLS